MSSPTSTSDRELDDYLRQYGDINVSRDAKTLSSLWRLPGLLIEANDVVKALTTRDEVVAAVSPAHPIYEQLGVSRCRHTVLERADPTETVTRARVRWHFTSLNDEHLTDADFEYVLRRDHDGLLLHVGIAIDVAQRFAELAQRQGIELE